MMPTPFWAIVAAFYFAFWVGVSCVALLVVRRVGTWLLRPRSAERLPSAVVIRKEGAVTARHSYLWDRET
jgi:hypothetical protein